MFKKFVSALTLICLLAPSVTQAVDLTSMFKGLSGSDNMSAVDAPGVFKSASRTVVSLGGYDMRAPARSTLSLYSITPPTLSYSCSGISAHFGGFSFISGKQIEKFINDIIRGAPGLVLQLAIKGLCPQCESVLQVMQTLATRAAKMAQDSCAIGTSLEQYAETSMGLNKPDDVTYKMCGMQVTAQNRGPDLLSALGDACQTVNGSLENMKEGLTSQGVAPATADSMLTTLKGNETWEALKALKYNPQDPEDRRTMLFIMNLVGTQMHGDGKSIPTVSTTPTADASAASAPAAGGTTPAPTYTPESGILGTGVPKDLVVTRQVTVQFMYDMFMCGVPAKGADGTVIYPRNRVVRDYCRRFVSSDWESQTIYDCKDGDYDNCLVVQEVPIRNLAVIQGSGLLFQVSEALRNGVDIVRNNSNTKIDWNAPQTKTLAALFQAAPYPLYQAINAAAVYPAAADDLVDSLSIMVAELMSYRIFDDMMSPQGRSGPAHVTSPAIVNRMYDALGSIRAASVEQRKLLGQQLALQEGISRRIFQINQTIQKQVMSNDFLGNSRFSSSVAAKTADGK